MVHIDISFNTSNGQEAASLVNKYLDIFPHLRQMVILLKFVLNCRGLNEVWTGGLGSYALTLLVVNFFQQHPRETAKESGENLGTLLLEFFELYGRHFNHEQNGIQVRNEGNFKHEVQESKKNFSRICTNRQITRTNGRNVGQQAIRTAMYRR